MSNSKAKVCAKCATETKQWKREQGLPVCAPMCARDEQLPLLDFRSGLEMLQTVVSERERAALDADIKRSNLRYFLTGAL